MLVRPPCTVFWTHLDAGALITTCKYCLEPRRMKTHEVRTRKGNNERDIRINFFTTWGFAAARVRCYLKRPIRVRTLCIFTQPHFGAGQNA